MTTDRSHPVTPPLEIRGAVVPRLTVAVRAARRLRGGAGSLVVVMGVAFSVLPTIATAAELQRYPIPVDGGVRGVAEAIVSGPDGALWFTVPGADRIGRVTTSGSFTAYPVTPGSHPLGLAAGPDGALWFTEATASRIGRITTAGVIAEGAITPGSQPAGITAGPDGALWFTETAGNRIGRIATNGMIAEYPLPTPQAHPVTITAGPDGALWFTEAAASQIGRIDPATHSFTEFPAHPAGPVPPSAPQGITAGPDGALWFTDEGLNKIGRLTVTGALTEFNAAPGPFGITLGRDGALWFTQTGMGIPGAPSIPGLMGRLTPDGVLDSFPLAPQTGESPNDITAGPDGAIWVTDGAAIGRVSGDLSARVPVISDFSMTRRSFRVPDGPRRVRTTFRFKLSTNGSFSIEILRRVPRKHPGAFPFRHVTSLERTQVPAGRQSVGFTGYDGNGNGHPLPPGRYRAAIMASGTRTGTQTGVRVINFKILR